MPTVASRAERDFPCPSRVPRARHSVLASRAMRARLFVSFASVSLFGSFALAACGGDAPPPQAPAKPFTAAITKPTSPPVEAPSSIPYAQLSRDEFNRRAVLLNVPLFWAGDTNGNKAIDPNEVRALLFYL